MLIGSAIIYLLISIFFTVRFFKNLSISKIFISFFLIVISGNIIICEILHFFKLLNSPFWFLTLQIIISTILIFILWDPKKRIFKESFFPFHFHFEKINRFDFFLGALIAGILVGVFYIGTLSPINNSDSLHVHLPRIYYWLQHGSFESWPAVTSSQIVYPINICIQGLWIFLLGKSESLFFIIPWFGLLVAVILVIEIAQLLGSSKRGALVAGLIILSFPVVLLQTYSFQGDVFVSTLILITIYFILLFIKNRTPHFLYFSGLALAVAIGAKQTAILFIPMFALILLLLLIKKMVSWRILFNTLGLTLAFFMVFSSLRFIQNFSDTKTEKTYMVSPTFMKNLITSTERPFEGYSINFLRYFYQSINLDGLTGRFRIDAENIKKEVFRNITEKIGIDLETNSYSSPTITGDFSYDDKYSINEDASWFGPLFYPLLLISIIVVLFSKNKDAKRYLLLTSILAVIFIFGQVVLKTAWGPNRGRHMTIAVLSMGPLFAFIIPKNRITSGITSSIIAFCSIILASSILIFNDSRPLVGKNLLTKFSEGYVAKIKVTNIFNSQYRKRLYDFSTDLLLTAPVKASILNSSYNKKLYYQNTYEIPNLDFVNQYIESDDPLYLIADNTLLEYGLFGRNKTRDLFPINDYHDVPSGSYLLVQKGLNISISEYQLLGENNYYQIFYKS